MSAREIRFGIIGCGMMGRELASAAARWFHLQNLDFRPVITAACNTSAPPREWFAQNVSTVRYTTPDYRALLDDPEIDAVYCAVPHDRHEQIYIDAIQAGKHLLGEKPFGIDLPANQAILEAARRHPGVLVRCSSQFAFYPGAYRIARLMRENAFGRIIDVEAGFWHSSDLDPNKPINWKRRVSTCGEYGVMGDLGMHVLYLPLRAGWLPESVSALLSKIITERPGPGGEKVPCDTWDNAVLACRARAGELAFPLLLSFKRIAPGHANTWFIRINGTELSAAFSTQNLRQVQLMPYTPGGAQEWRTVDQPYRSAYDSITGPIFEFGFSDAMLQMFAAFCDELAHGPGGMLQPLACAAPEEAALSHRLFTAALQSQRDCSAVRL